jgi:hypothetical protein
MSASNALLKRPSRRKPLAACVAAVFALSVPGLVHATDRLVTNCANTGAGSFRAAAAAAASGDTINLTTISDFSACTSGSNGPHGTIAHTITVSSTVSVATGGVTINGPGSAALAVSAGAGAFRVITSPGDLTINGLTVKYAAPTASSGTLYGGCILANNKLTLNDVGLTHCYAYNSAGSAKGGAVASFDSDVIMTNVYINRTHATAVAGSAMGGAVYAFHNVNMTDSTITTGGPYLCLFPPCTPPTTSVGAYVTSGTGSALGGGVFSKLTGYSVTLSGSTIQGTHAVQNDNTATGGSGSGGGVWSLGDVGLQNSTVSSSVASTKSTSTTADSLGGGVYSGGNVTTDSSAVRANTTYSKGRHSRGAGIYATGNTAAYYSYVTFNHATGNAKGGGLYSKSGLSSKYSFFHGNASDNSAGGASVPTGNSFLRGTTVSFNSSGLGFNGFDLWAGGASTVTIEQSTFAQNFGGGGESLYIRAKTTKLYNNSVVQNTGPFTPGVIVRAGDPGSTLVMTSNLVAQNTGAASPNDLVIGAGVAATGDANLIQDTTALPTGTGNITGVCPLLYPGKFLFSNKQYQWYVRHEIKSPATDAGSNPKGFGADQRGGYPGATSPARASSQPGVVTPLPDIGAYEIDQSDEIFDNRFDAC